MSVKNGYANKTIYKVMVDNDNTDNDTVTTIIQTAAVTAAGTTGTAANTSGVTSNSYSSPINAEIAGGNQPAFGKPDLHHDSDGGD